MWASETPCDDDAEREAASLAGPTRDSGDVLSEMARYAPPLSRKIGDRVRIPTCGTCTTACGAVTFNGFEPLKAASERSRKGSPEYPFPDAGTSSYASIMPFRRERGETPIN